MWRKLVSSVGLLLGLTTLCLGAITFSSRAQTACLTEGGRVERLDYYAASIQTRMVYSLYLPPCYDDTATRYPLLTLMHGSNEDDGHWLRLGLAEQLDTAIAAGEYPPVIVLLPFGNWIANENRFGAASWDTVFLDQLLPLVESSHRIDPERRAIGGISRGGFWAFQLALRFPAMFDAVGGHSAFFDLYHAPPQYNPLHLAVNAGDIDTLRIALDRGADDFAAPGLDEMHARLTQRGIDHDYTIYPEGQHNNAYWRQHVAAYLDFYMAAWQTEPPPSPGIWATATPGAPATSDSSAMALYLPAVAFPSRQATLDRATLDRIAAGEREPRLIVSPAVAEALRAHGIDLHPETRRADDIAAALWRDRTVFTLLPFDALTPRLRVLHIDERHPLDSDLAAYPFAFASDTPNYDPAHLTRILFSGVTALGRQTLTALDANGIDWAAGGILERVQRPDYFHTSSEVSFVAGCPNPSGATVLGGSSSMCAREAHFDLFTRLDVDIVELTGNHNNDYGYAPYQHTLDWFHAQGIATLGGGADEAAAQTPLVIEHNGQSIALVACNWAGPYYALANDDPNLLGGVRPGAADCNGAWLRDSLPQLATTHDLVVVTVQHREYDSYTPTDSQRADFRSLADLGADVVLGTASHFPQVFEFYQGSSGSAFIHYGMGNLFFDQEFFAGVRFFMDELTIYEGRLLTVDLFTGIIEDQGRPRAMTPDERENFLFLIFNEYGGM